MCKYKDDASSWGSSLKYLPWDHTQENSSSLKLIFATVHEWYDAKHISSSIEEVTPVNSVEVTSCRCCGSVKIITYGKYRSGIKRSYCNDCNRSFSALTGTIFEDRKIPISKWIEYLIHLFEFHSITTSIRDNRNAYSTGGYWLFKVFAVLEDFQKDIILTGNGYLDETFFSVVESKKEHRENGKK